MTVTVTSIRRNPPETKFCAEWTEPTGTKVIAFGPDDAAAREALRNKRLARDLARYADIVIGTESAMMAASGLPVAPDERRPDASEQRSAFDAAVAQYEADA